jgi:hypothetical protein
MMRNKLQLDVPRRGRCCGETNTRRLTYYAMCSFAIHSTQLNFNVQCETIQTRSDSHVRRSMHRLLSYFAEKRGRASS